MKIRPLSKRSARTGTGSGYERIIKFSLVAAGVIVLATGGAWLYVQHNDPDRLFWAMMNNNLSTQAVSRTALQDDGQQKVRQVTEAQTSPDALANGQTTIVQGGEQGATAITESIGTPTADYVRYTKVETSQKGADGAPLDFSGVLNVWGVSKSEDGTTSGQLYNEAVLGLFPVGSLTASQRKALIGQMKDTNAYTFMLDKTERHGARVTYIYNVKINPVAFVSVLKQFASDMGLNQLKNVDPNQYSSTQPIDVQVSIDNLSRQMTRVSYSDGYRVETLSGYGSLKPLQQPPTKTISVDELQYRLQSVQ